MKEISQEVRTIAAIVLSVVVIGIWTYIFRPKPQVAPAEIPAAQKSAAPAPAGGSSMPSAGGTAVPTAAAANAAGAAEAVHPGAPSVRAADAEQALVVESSLYHVELSNRGASVRSWQLSAFREENGKTLDLVHPAVALQSGRWPLMLALDNAQAEQSVNGVLYQMTPPSGVVRAPAKVEFNWSDGHLAVSKKLTFGTDYIVSIETEVTLDGKPVPHAVAWRGGFGDVSAFAAADQVHVVYSRGGSLSDIPAKKAGDSNHPASPAVIPGLSDFGGITDHYFAAAFLPDGASGIALEHWKYDRDIVVDGKQDTEAVAEVAASEPGVNPMRLRLYVGPKAVGVLEHVEPPLTGLITFGWLAVVARPLFDFLIWIHRYVPNYGWAIVVMTLIINMVLFPLKYRGFHQMLKMQKVMPEIKQIQDRYKKYSIRDPRKQEMNQEVMAVYNREGVNPMGGCLPTVIQMPIWFALYRMLDVAIELRQAPWMWWIHDLSARDAFYILPILICLTQYFMQKLTPMTTADPAQQRMMTIMPLFMGFIFFRLASGLLLYIVTSNLVATGQQWFLYRTMKDAKDINGKKDKPGKKSG